MLPHSWDKRNSFEGKGNKSYKNICVRKRKEEIRARQDTEEEEKKHNKRNKCKTNICLLCVKNICQATVKKLNR